MSASKPSSKRSLNQHRQAIDELDVRIVKLLNERTRHVLGIGAIKRRAGEEFYQPHRESEVFKRLERANVGPLPAGSLRSIYREVMSSALAMEKSMTIAYLGPEATFTHEAAIHRFGSSLTYAPQRTIAEVFSEVARGRADYGVVPIENSTEGAVTHTLDMFVDSDLKIVAQIVRPIQQCLQAKIPRKRIQRLYVHPQTLAQCRNWIGRNLPDAELIETSSNARSAELAGKDSKAGAIGGLLAAEKYGLKVLEKDVQDSSSNATRFLVLGRKCSPSSGQDRTSLMFSLVDRVGALHDSLEAFRRNGINMTKIESRPSKRKAWEYYFFVDIDGHLEDSKVAQAVKRLARHCTFVKVLGSYPNAE
ncbi:MAG: prephenate dehydratase [Verrucomicrobia bacterium]|nr:prephenate dehydratase [Verrucomicrobiota bacterium]